LKTFEAFYAKKEYANALQVLQKNSASISPSLYHYNVGTAEAAMKHWAKARFHFLQASRSGLTSEALANNLRITETELNVGRLENPIGVRDHFFQASLIAAEGWLTTLSLLILVIGLWGMRKTRDMKTMIVTLVLVLLPLGFNLWIDSWPKSIVEIPQAIKEGPSTIFGNTGELPAGVLVITKKQEGWEEIIYPARYQGWIKSNGLLRLE
jgi:hypothetical protein